MKISRRDFLKSLLALTSAAALSACKRVDLTPSAPAVLPAQPSQLPAPTDTPQPTPAPSVTPTPTETTAPTATDTAAPTSTDTLTPTPVLVRLLAPQDGAVLPALGRVSFSWEPFAGAADYLLEITNPSGNTFTNKTEKTQIDRYIQSLPWAGEYTWRVLATDAGGTELASSLPWRFSKPFSPTEEPTEPSDGMGGDGIGGSASGGSSSSTTDSGSTAGQGTSGGG